jgi:hypothetical protein
VSHHRAEVGDVYETPRYGRATVEAVDEIGVVVSIVIAGVPVSGWCPISDVDWWAFVGRIPEPVVPASPAEAELARVHGAIAGLLWRERDALARAAAGPWRNRALEDAWDVVRGRG